jgi:hypothetical protein
VVSIELAGIQRLRRKIGTACTWQDKLRCIIRPPEWKPPAKEA